MVFIYHWKTFHKQNFQATFPQPSDQFKMQRCYINTHSYNYMLGNTLYFLYLYVSFYSSPVLLHNLHSAKFHWFLLLNNPVTWGKKSHVSCLRQGKDNSHCRRLLEVCISHSSNFKTVWSQCIHLAEIGVWKSNLPSREVHGFDFFFSDVSQFKNCGWNSACHWIL